MYFRKIFKEMIQHKYIMGSVQNCHLEQSWSNTYLQTSTRIIMPITHYSNHSFKSWLDFEENDEYSWLSVGISMRPLLSATSVSIRTPVPLLLVVQSRDCQLLLVPQNFKTTISQLLDITICHNHYLKIVFDIKDRLTQHGYPKQDSCRKIAMWTFQPWASPAILG